MPGIPIDFLQKHFQNSEDSGTIVPDESGEESGTMIQHSTLVSNIRSATSEIESNLGTMVINEDDDEDASETMKRKEVVFHSSYCSEWLGQVRLVASFIIKDWVESICFLLELLDTIKNIHERGCTAQRKHTQFSPRSPGFNSKQFKKKIQSKN